MSMEHEIRPPWAQYQDTAEILKELLDALDQRDYNTFQYLLQQPDVDLNCIGRCFEYICNNNDCGRFAKRLLKSGIDPNLVSALGKKPIHMAAESGNAPILELLLNDSRVEVNSVDGRGLTALHYVVKQRVVCRQDTERIRRCIRILLKHPHININKRCTNVYDTGATALHLAAGASKDVALTTLLGDKRTNVNVLAEAGKTALHYVAALNDRNPELSHMIKRNAELLLGRSDIDLNKRDSNGMTPMHIASLGNNYSAFEVLLSDHRIDANAIDNNGKTILHYEASKSDRRSSRRSQQERIMSIILDPRRGMDVNKVDCDGKTATHQAAESGNLVVWKALLLDIRTDVNIRDFNGRTVLHCIAGRHDTDPERVDNMEHCINILFDGRDSQMNTMSTVMSRDDSTCFRLDIDAIDINGETALYKAALARNQHLSRILLRRGASIKLKSSGSSPLDGLAPTTLETFLDECIEDNKYSLHSADYAVIFNFKFLSERNSNLLTPETEPLLLISQSKHLRNLLQHPIISTFIDLKWRRVQAFYYINIVFYTLFLIFLNWYVIYMTHHQKSDCKTIQPPKHIQIPLLSLLLYIILRELFEIVIYPINYIKSVENYMEVIMLILTGIILLKENDWANCSTFRVFLVVSLLLSWIEWVLLTGRLPFLSIQVEMLKTVSITFITFMAWYSFMIVAFAISFYTLFYENSGTDEPFNDLATSIFKTIVMMAGEFEADSIEFKNAANIYSHLVFIFFVILIAMVMINLLNGLAVNDTHAIKKQAQILSQESRLRSSFYIESIASIDTSKCNWISKRILCCLPFINTKKISIFANINHDMKVFVFPNRMGHVSFTGPINNGRQSIMQYEFVKTWHYSYVKINSTTVKSALNILMKQKVNIDYPIKELVINLQDTTEKYKQKLEEMERKFNETITRMLYLIEHRRFQTDA